MNDLQENLERRESGAVSIAIAATFTAEPVETSVRFWMRELGMPTTIAFAPYNQVFQQLLDPTSLLATNQNGVNIVLVRLEDWQRDLSETHGAPDPDSDIGRNVRDFIRALITAVEHGPSTYLVCLCPNSPSVSAIPEQRSLFGAMEERIVSELSAVNGVEVVTTSDLTAAYPVSEFYDYHADKLAHIPYIPVFYTALGTMIARRLYALRGTPYKVIVLDCDETLWSGVCGEDGPAGIQIDVARKGLQEFMVQQHKTGMLICLCSKNNEEDVLEVFGCRNDMILRRDHISAWRINWNPKSENIQSLSRELGVGLDSFILVDDDAVECAEVRERCPEILTLQLPKNPDLTLRFLKHVWAFDPRKTTEEDRQRATLYQQHRMREHIRHGSLTLRDFLANLNLEVRISPLSPGEIGRVSELSLRTNQFNLTTIRSTEAEIRQLCQPGGAECLVVRVRDRFGDYGLVGAMIFEAHADSLIAVTFLLSCRALGRGVEHKMLAALGAIAKQRGLSHVALRCIPSNKNRPALDFLEGLRDGVKEYLDNGFLARFAADSAASVSYNPEADNEFTAGEDALTDSDSTPTSEAQTRTALLSMVPETLYDPELIHKWLSENRPRPGSDTALAAPRTPVESKIAEIYSELLGIEPIGLHDGFFDLGGHSLLAMQVLSRANDAFQVELDPTLLFTTNFTVGELASAVLREQVRQVDPQDIAVMLKKLSELTDDEAQKLLDNQAIQSQDRENR